MRGGTIRPRLRRLLTPPAIAVALAASLGATHCEVGGGQAAQPSSTNKKATTNKATGTVVRCHGSRSCDITFRRTTTERYLERLRGRAPSGVLATTTTHAACLLVTHTLTGHIVCAAGSALVTKQLNTALNQAAASKECLTIHLEPPAAGGTWRPISYGTTGGRDCAP